MNPFHQHEITPAAPFIHSGVLQEEHTIVISRPRLKKAISTPERTKSTARSDLKDVCHEVGEVVTLPQWSSELVLNWSHMLSMLELEASKWLQALTNTNLMLNKTGFLFYFIALPTEYTYIFREEVSVHHSSQHI